MNGSVACRRAAALPEYFSEFRCFGQHPAAGDTDGPTRAEAAPALVTGTSVVGWGRLGALPSCKTSKYCVIAGEKIKYRSHEVLVVRSYPPSHTSRCRHHRRQGVGLLSELRPELRPRLRWQLVVDWELCPLISK